MVSVEFIILLLWFSSLLSFTFLECLFSLNLLVANSHFFNAHFYIINAFFLNISPYWLLASPLRGTVIVHKLIVLSVCSHHVTHAFQSESTFYICLNVKELLMRNRRGIWSLSDCNGTRTHKHTLFVNEHSNDWLFVYELSDCAVT